MVGSILTPPLYTLALILTPNLNLDLDLFLVIREKE